MQSVGSRLFLFLSLSLSFVARKEEKPKKENVSLFAPNQAPKKAVRVAALSLGFDGPLNQRRLYSSRRATGCSGHACDMWKEVFQSAGQC